MKSVHSLVKIDHKHFGKKAELLTFSFEYFLLLHFIHSVHVQTHLVLF